MKKFLDVNDIKICVDDTESDKKPILLFHGLTGSKENTFYMRDMLKDDYRVICVDMRGHGESTRPLKYSLDDHARDAHEIIKVLGLGKADILGYSMGSYVALRTAQLGCDDIDHLILVCSKPYGDGSSVGRLLNEAGLDIKTVTEEEMTIIMRQALLSPNTLEKVKTGEFNFDEMEKYSGLHVLNEKEKAAEDASLAGFDNSLDYNKVTCKTLVISAEFDGINPPELGKKIADGIRGARYELIRDAGHAVGFEQPDEFKRVVKEFLKS